jgi:hypothetical protein
VILTLAVPHPHIINNKLAFRTVYNQHLHPPLEWQTALKICPEDVMNGFFLYLLLLNKAEWGASLVLSYNKASQKDRLQPALEEHNRGTEGIGQENYPHM